MILTPDPFFVFGQVAWQVDFVASAAKLSGLKCRLEHLALVKRRLGLDQEHIDLLQNEIFAIRERIMLWLFDDVIGVASSRLDFGNRMAYRTSDPGLAGRIVDIVVMRIVESPREERDRIMASGAKTRRMDVSIPLHRDFASLSNGVQISRIVERAEMVRTVEPIVVNTLMALLAVLVVHQSPLRDKVSVAGASERIFKIPLPIGRSTLAPFPWILGLRNEHRSNSKRRSNPNSLGYHPTDPGPHQPM